MDVDGFIKLGDASLRCAQARADVCNTLADAHLKYAQLPLIQQQVVKAKLENLARFLDIKWDAQAHAHLYRIRNQTAQEARRARSEAHLAKIASNRLGRLIQGGAAWEQVRDAWLSFNRIVGRLDVRQVAKAFGTKVGPEAYRTDQWAHPAGTHIKDGPEKKNVGDLFKWAAQHTLYPQTGTAAWDLLADVLEVMAESCAAEAANLTAAAEAAQNEAREIAKIDWDRLKQS